MKNTRYTRKERRAMADEKRQALVREIIQEVSVLTSNGESLSDSMKTVASYRVSTCCPQERSMVVDTLRTVERPVLATVRRGGAA